MSQNEPPAASPSDIVPILPLRNAVLFPAAAVPINVGRPRSVKLIEDATAGELKVIGVVTQRTPETEDPTAADLYTVGTLARIVKVIRVGASNYSVFLQGLGRFELTGVVSEAPYLRGRITRHPESLARTPEIERAAKDLRELARGLLDFSPPVPRDLGAVVENTQDPGALADLVTLHLPSPPVQPSDRQRVLEAFDLLERLGLAHQLARRVREVYRVKKDIQTLVSGDMQRSEREEILRAQLRTIKEELGETDETEEEIDQLRERIAKAKMPQDTERLARRQLGRLRAMQSHSAEYQVTRSYVEWLTDLPWHKSTEDRYDLQAIQQALDEDHFGLDKIKRRIVEYMAVRKLRKDKKGPILCFIGPPGVGKTSLAKSIARAIGRQLVRISLGGVRDEAEIRGHRRTYVGALPGRIIQGMKKAGTVNPVLVLDEIDKMGSDVRGDPASALLEVLDPEQNNTFVDHYVDQPYDLSAVMFLCTANDKGAIPSPLLDRTEVIELAGYTRREKMAIARDYLIPTALSEHGLSPERLAWEPDGVEALVDSYTREAGVRNLRREVESVCRAVAVRLAAGEDVKEVANAAFIEKVLGPRKYTPEMAERAPQPGVVTGLAWTPVGGDILFVEATKMPGKGGITVTGQLGNVMKESAAAAMSWVRSHTAQLGLPTELLEGRDVHVHVPKGAVPKDGPSAGVGLVTAVVSLLSNRPVRADLAMTGEITLRGVVMPIGGVKEKVMAAHRAGIKKVLLPTRNRKDLEEIPAEVREALEIDFVGRIEEVLEHALLPALPEPPAPKSAAGRDEEEDGATA